MVDECSEVFGVEEMDAVEIRDVHSPCVGGRTVRAVLLDMETKETDFDTVDLFKHKQSFGSVRELLGEVTLQPEREGREGI